MMLLLLSLLGLVPTFQKSKCKKLLNTTMERIKLLSSRRDAQLRQLRGDLMKLLQLGKRQKAQVWLAHICKETQLRSVYIKISAYCQRVQVNLTDIAGHSDCPESLQEPLAGLCFAASCCADLPELQELREIFTMKYGKNFVASAHELGRKCLVKEEAVEEIAADDELKQGIEKAWKQQQGQELQAIEDAENNNGKSVPHHEDGCDFVQTSARAAPAMQELVAAGVPFEEGTCKKRQKIHGDRNCTCKEPVIYMQADNTATMRHNDGSDQELSLYMKQSEFSLPPERPPPLPRAPSRTPPPPPPCRSASMPSFSHYVKSEASSSDISSPLHHGRAMSNNRYSDYYKGGILVHPRLPMYEDLVASFSALKH